MLLGFGTIVVTRVGKRTWKNQLIDRERKVLSKTVPLYSALIGNTVDAGRVYYSKSTHTGMLDDTDCLSQIVSVIRGTA